MVDKPQVKKL